MKSVLTRTPNTVHIDTDAIPAHQSDAMCRTLIGCINRMFEDPAVQAGFERWKKERQKRKEVTQ